MVNGEKQSDMSVTPHTLSFTVNGEVASERTSVDRQR
jgi:hypothetical protein